LARFTMLIISACCCAVLSPGLLGQSILATVATHTARNSRGAGGGMSATEGFVKISGRCQLPVPDPTLAQPANNTSAIAAHDLTTKLTNKLEKEHDGVARLIL